MTVARRLASLAVVGLLSGCGAPVPPETRSSPDWALEPVPAQAVVYVFRDQRFAADRMVPVRVNDRATVSLPADCYVRWTLEPGSQRVAAAEGEPVRLSLAAGERAFLRASVSVTGNGVGGRLTRVGADEGAAAVSGARMILTD